MKSKVYIFDIDYKIFRVERAKVQYSCGLLEMEDVIRILVTAMVTPIVSSLCPSVVQLREGKFYLYTFCTVASV